MKDGTLLLLNYFALCTCAQLNLPSDHIPFHLKTSGKCWGYETDCKVENSFSQNIECETEQDPFSARKSRDVFFDEADFGYVRQRQKTLMSICEPRNPKESSLVCSKDLQFCVGRKIMIDFTDLPNRTSELLRYSMDVLREGQIGGSCLLHQKRLRENFQYMAPLQSWAPELQNFIELNSSDLLSDDLCDVIVERPTFLLKIDASVNYYHHFCDFFNLYASLHLNSTHKDMYSQDVHFLVWENRPYHSNFDSAFEAFTVHSIWDLNTFGGKKVCFKNIVMPLLPRMIFGLYYNTPLFSNCRNSGLFRAFSQFMLYRLNIPLPAKTDRRKLRITIIKRMTKYRRILNLDELVTTLEHSGQYDVTVAEFSHFMPFKKQLEIVRKTDILIGIHGAGLTHLLFLPDWASVFELHHCEDPGCYQDLARLRGIHYITWTNTDLVYPEDEGHHPSQPGKGHAKFTNYAFDKEEFSEKVELAARSVRAHPEFQKLDRPLSEDKTEL